MKYVEYRGKIIAYLISLNAMGIKIDVDFKETNRPNQYVDLIHAGEPKLVKMWDLPHLLYGMVIIRADELLEFKLMYEGVNK